MPVAAAQNLWNEINETKAKTTMKVYSKSIRRLAFTREHVVERRTIRSLNPVHRGFEVRHLKNRGKFRGWKSK